MKNFQEKKTVLLAALYMFFVLGGASTYVGVFAYLPEYAGVSLVEFSLAPSINSVVVALLSFFGAAVVIKKWGPRTCMLLGSAMLIVYSLLIGLFPGIIALYAGFALGGVITSISGVACLSDLMVRLYGEKSGAYISILIGTMSVGQGVTQGVSTTIMSAFGMKMVFLGEILVCGIGAFICALLIQDKSPNSAAADNQQTAASAAAGGEKKESVLKNPAVWCMCIATLGMPLAMSPVLLYATDYFPSFGEISISAAGTMVGIMGIATGVYNMFIGGKLIGKFGAKMYAVWIMVCMAATSVFAHLYGTIPQIWVLVLVVLCYAVGCTSSQLTAVLAPALFGPEASTDVTAKAMSFMFAGNIVGSPLIAWVLTNLGYGAVWIMAIGVCAVIIAIYLLTFALMGKRQASQAAKN